MGEADRTGREGLAVDAGAVDAPAGDPLAAHLEEGGAAVIAAEEAEDEARHLLEVARPGQLLLGLVERGGRRARAAGAGGLDVAQGAEVGPLLGRQRDALAAHGSG